MSVTRSGKSYKQHQAISTRMETPQDIQQCLKLLMEDRQKREEEIAAERAEREQRYQEERQRREREMEERMKLMQGHIEGLMKMVEGSKSVAAQPAVKLVPLKTDDDIESYLVTFERIMGAHKIEMGLWPHHLVPQLSGKAQLAFAALATGDISNYDAIKTAILARYDINEESYRNRFRTAKRKDGETSCEFGVRLMDTLAKWLKEYKTVEQIREVLGIEQLLDTLSMDKRLWLIERKPKTCVQAGELLDEYETARRREGERIEIPSGLVENTGASTAKCSYCGRAGHEEEECRKKARDLKGKSAIPKCYKCGKVGHIARFCRDKGALLCMENRESLGSKGRGVRWCTVEGKRARVLLDTGCTRTMVRRHLVPPHKFIEGKGVTVHCAHGDTTFYPVAEVNIRVSGVPLLVEAAVADSLPVPVLLGTDVPQLFQLLGQTIQGNEAEAENVLVVTTRSRAREQLEEEMVRNEKERVSGARPSPASGLAEHKAILDDHRPTSVSQVEKGPLDMAAPELQVLQEKDPTLQEARNAAEHSSGKNKTGFFKRNGILYRRWIPDGYEEREVEQLVLPTKCRQAVLKLAHEIPLSGHLGKEKTRKRILRRFFWPSVYRDVERFCASCPVCQKTAPRGSDKAPLVPLPIISEPFRRIGMNIVGPLPRSKSGHKYVLVLCDYATRYPEAVPLKSIDAENIAEKLVEVFARVGIPEEILTDQGSNFVSQLLAELYRLLHVRPIRTSPYHPQTDGLVVRFNRTLKEMLRKTASIEGRDWDKLLPYLLFAYREVPQASTGFLPFELIYGREVRGPLDILKETWEADQKFDESVVSYVLATREKLEDMVDCVKQNMEAQQARQKKWYDTRARLKEFKPGDAVLVLLPTSTNKLLAQWQGPYSVLERRGKVTYLVDMHDRRKRKRVFHVNMLKAFKVRDGSISDAFQVEEEEAEDAVDDIPVWREPSVQKPAYGEHLSQSQRAQLERVIASHHVFSDEPGRTNLAVHRIATADASPVRLPPYRLPQAYRNTVKEEIQEMLQHQIIEPSKSEWASPIVLVTKKDGSVRMCVDYRRLNAVTKVEAYPMPRIDDLIDTIGQSKFITTLDLSKGYWQVPVAKEDRYKTAFCTPSGLYQFRVMPFGLAGAPGTFQRLMDNVLRGCEGYATAYLDDIVIHTATWEDHVAKLNDVLRRIQKAGLTVKLEKCQFAMSQCVYLGHLVGNGEI